MVELVTYAIIIIIVIVSSMRRYALDVRKPFKMMNK